MVEEINKLTGSELTDKKDKTMAKSAAIEKLEGEIKKVKELLEDANDDTKPLYEASLERKKDKLKNLIAGEAEGNKG